MKGKCWAADKQVIAEKFQELWLHHFRMALDEWIAPQLHAMEKGCVLMEVADLMQQQT